MTGLTRGADMGWVTVDSLAESLLRSVWGNADGLVESGVPLLITFMATGRMCLALVNRLLDATPQGNPHQRCHVIVITPTPNREVQHHAKVSILRFIRRIAATARMNLVDARIKWHWPRCAVSPRLRDDSYHMAKYLITMVTVLENWEGLLRELRNGNDDWRNVDWEELRLWFEQEVTGVN
jgi:hypothetical protein